MAQFDVYRFTGRLTPLIVDVQSDVLSDLASRVVVPLTPVTSAIGEELPRLKPRVTVEGKDYLFMATDIGALPASRLGPWVASTEDEHRDAMTNALDFLFFGF